MTTTGKEKEMFFHCFYVTVCVKPADAKSNPSYSSELHLLVFQDMSEKGALIFSKICLKKHQSKDRHWHRSS